MHMKIPNQIATKRIIDAVLTKFQLRNSLSEGLLRFVDNGELDQVLGCYQQLMTQRDVTLEGLTKTSETQHRDSFYFCLIKNHLLVPNAKVQVTKVIYSMLTISWTIANVSCSRTIDPVVSILLSRLADIL